jgi:hypothetical protein
LPNSLSRDYDGSGISVNEPFDLLAHATPLLSRNPSVTLVVETRNPTLCWVTSVYSYAISSGLTESSLYKRPLTASLGL